MGKWIIGTGRLRLHGIEILLRMGPRIVTACIHRGILLLYRLLLLLWLTKISEAVGLLSPWIVRVECSLLGLDEILLWLLLPEWRAKTSLLRLVLLLISIAGAVLITSHLWLHTKSSVLLLLWINDISKPVHSRLLLITLIPACWLSYRRLNRRVIEQGIGIRFLQLPTTEIFLLLAQLERLGKIGVLFNAVTGCSPALSLFLFRFSLASLKCSTKLLIILFCLSVLTAWPGYGSLVVMRSKFFDTGDS
jgi:hypothetical protein